MADIVEFQKNPFWKKKFDKAIALRDADKSGKISRRDFEIMVLRYKQFETTRPDKWEKLSKLFLQHCDDIGLSDPNEELTYEEFKERWMAGISNTKSLLNAKEATKQMFSILDTDSMSGRIITLL